VLLEEASERLAEAAERVLRGQPDASELAAVLMPELSNLAARKLSSSKMAALAEALLAVGSQRR
jgi:hypothetical protein